MTKSDLISSLRYQILCPQVSTWGSCRQATCPNSARGAGVCSTCLQADLIQLVGDEEKVVKYVAALVAAANASYALEDLEEEL